MTGEIRVAFDTDTGRVMVGAAMDTQEQKNLSIGILLSAIKLIMDYKPSAIIKPAGMPNGGGNGKPPIPITTH